MDSSDVLTIADQRAQDYVVTNLKTHFPKLKIIGEEGEEIQLHRALESTRAVFQT